MPCTLEKELRVEKGSRGANRTGTHISALPRRKSGYLYAFWPRNKAKANLISIKMCRRVWSRYIRGQKSPQTFVGLKIRLKEDEPARLHVNRCAQAAMWTSSRMITDFTFSEHGVPALFAEPDGDGPNEVKNTLWKQFPMKKWCWSHPRQGTFPKILSLRVGRMWMEASTVTCVSEENFCLLLAINILIVDTLAGQTRLLHITRVTLPSFWRRPTWPPWKGMIPLQKSPSLAQ